VADGSPLSARLDASVWAGIGAVGILVFLVGIYRPALAGVPYDWLLEIVLAVAGACLAVAGFSFALDQRKAAADRPRRVRRVPAELTDEFGPTFEVYDPRTAEESLTPPGPRTPPEQPPEP